jgi:hypothetical protein
MDGVVASVEAQKGNTLIEFKVESCKEAVYNGRSTAKVDRIDFSGPQAQVLYQQHCTPAGYETRRSQLSPMVVPSEYVGGIRPGVRLRVSQGRVNAPNANAPLGLGLEGFADEARNKLIHVLAIAL